MRKLLTLTLFVFALGASEKADACGVSRTEIYREEIDCEIYVTYYVINSCTGSQYTTRELFAIAPE